MVDVAPAAGMKSFEETLKTLGPEVQHNVLIENSHVIKTISHVSSELMQEITKIEKSFKDPKFMELLVDYAKDMADPEVHAACRLCPMHSLWVAECSALKAILA